MARSRYHATVRSIPAAIGEGDMTGACGEIPSGTRSLVPSTAAAWPTSSMYATEVRQLVRAQELRVLSGDQAAEDQLAEAPNR